MFIISFIENAQVFFFFFSVVNCKDHFQPSGVTESLFGCHKI